MSAHVTDQLGAFLDGEIPSAERAVVAAHLRDCAACARRLEEMAAVDDLARSLTVEAPAGYFDTFAARVRGKLRSSAKRRFAPPVWTLAVAAALLLAVLTPLTIRQIQTPPSEPAAVPVPAPPLQERAAPPVTIADAPARVEPEAKRAQKDAKAEPVREERRAAKEVETQAPAPAAVPRPASPALLKKEDARLDEPASAPAVAFAPAPAESLEVDAAKSKMASSSADAESAPPQPRERGAAAGAGTSSGGLVASRNAVPGFTAAELRYRALLARGAATVADARSLREAWRVFAQAEPAGPRSDEARVRVIEAGALAYRLSGEEEDRGQAERDAAAYLARSDAGQPSRVRAALATLAP
jgi:anti-sigma factor RsiW